MMSIIVHAFGHEYNIQWHEDRQRYLTQNTYNWEFQNAILNKIGAVTTQFSNLIKYDSELTWVIT
jgi:hypothetical protein